MNNEMYDDEMFDDETYGNENLIDEEVFREAVRRACYIENGLFSYAWDEKNYVCLLPGADRPKIIKLVNIPKDWF